MPAVKRSVAVRWTFQAPFPSCFTSSGGWGVPRSNYVSRSQRELTYGPGEPALLAVGEVRMVEEEMNPYVIS